MKPSDHKDDLQSLLDHYWQTTNPPESLPENKAPTSNPAETLPKEYLLRDVVSHQGQQELFYEWKENEDLFWQAIPSPSRIFSSMYEDINPKFIRANPEEEKLLISAMSSFQSGGPEEINYFTFWQEAEVYGPQGL